MAVQAKCPRCQGSVVGSRIFMRGTAPWKTVRGLIGRATGSGATNVAQPDGFTIFFVVGIECSHCNLRTADILCGNEELVADKRSDFRRKCNAYLSGEIITEAVATLITKTQINVAITKDRELAEACFRD